MTNYKLIDDIALELAGKMKIQQLQDKLAAAWKPYMQDRVVQMKFGGVLMGAFRHWR